MSDKFLEKYEEELVETLDRQYRDYIVYVTKIETLKEMGYKVYRNADGKHRITKDKDYLKNVFGGAFKNI